MRFFLLSVLSLTCLVYACSPKNAAADATGEPDARPVAKLLAWDEAANLRMGEAVRVAKPANTLTFLSVASDSRCPRGMTCVTQGEAYVNVALNGGAARRVRIGVGERTPARLAFDGGVWEFTALDPYPTNSVAIDPEARILRVKPVRAAAMR